MARNPENASIWTDARVYMSTAVERPAIPADITASVTEANDYDFAAGWIDFGLLDGENGFGEERSSDETKHYAWGAGLIKIGNRNFELTRTFTLLEPENPSVQAVLWPGSTDTKLVMPKPLYAWLGFETVSDQGRKERLFTVQRAQLSTPSNNRNESDLTRVEVTAYIIGKTVGSNVEMFDRQATGVAPVTP